MIMDLFNRLQHVNERLRELEMQDSDLAAWAKVYDSLFKPIENELEAAERLLRNFNKVFELARQVVKEGKIQVKQRHKGIEFKTTKVLVIGAIRLLEDEIMLFRELTEQIPELIEKHDMFLPLYLFNHDRLLDILSNAPNNKRNKPPPREALQLIFEYSRDKRRKELEAQGIDATGPIAELADLAIKVPFTGGEL